MSRTSISIGNLRAFVILLVVSFHSVLAYLGSQPAAQAPFDMPPYDWRAFPILDNERWFGFDVYCAFQYVFLMPLMFFLSGLFVWPSLSRKGTKTFLYDRSLRIGIPFALAAGLLMPVAHYPVYRLTAVDPSWSAYWTHWTALPFWAVGPLWFLWQILLLDFAAAALFQFAPRAGKVLGRLSANAGEHPGRYFFVFAAISAIAYLPLAVFFKPWEWNQVGPFSVQSGRILHFAVCFFAGIAVGVNGIENGLLDSNGMLARRWAAWSAIALAVFLSWLGGTAVTMDGQRSLAPYFERASDLLFVLSSTTACFAFVAIFLRFAVRRLPVADNISSNAYSIYLVHYLFVIWLQYLLLGMALFAVAKGAIVFAGALMLSWATAIILRRIPIGIRLVMSN
jgi:hypothetical protein